MSLHVLKQHSENGLTILTIDRPHAMNTMNGELVDVMYERFKALDQDPDTRVIILTATGDRAFCAGADLKERKEMTEEEVAQRIVDYRKAFAAIEKVRQPTIAAINGYAFGGGLEIALACDLRVMSATTQIGLTETRIGILPGAGGTQRLPRVVGPSKAKELIFMARRLGAEESYQIGLVNFVAPQQEVMKKAKEVADEILKGAPCAVQGAKKAINEGMQTDIDRAIEIESACYNEIIATEDRMEGLIAFKEKRAPNWQGK